MCRPVLAYEIRHLGGTAGIGGGRRRSPQYAATAAGGGERLNTGAQITANKHYCYNWTHNQNVVVHTIFSVLFCK